LRNLFSIFKKVLRRNSLSFLLKQCRCMNLEIRAEACVFLTSQLANFFSANGQGSFFCADWIVRNKSEGPQFRPLPKDFDVAACLTDSSESCCQEYLLKCVCHDKKYLPAHSTYLCFVLFSFLNCGLQFFFSHLQLLTLCCVTRVRLSEVVICLFQVLRVITKIWKTTFWLSLLSDFWTDHRWPFVRF
jgi:hypothetical protein